MPLQELQISCAQQKYPKIYLPGVCKIREKAFLKKNGKYRFLSPRF